MSGRSSSGSSIGGVIGMIVLGGSILILETFFGQENISIISTLLGLCAVASFLAAPYWNFKKAKKHSHLWNWQVIGVLTIVILGTAIT